MNNLVNWYQTAEKLKALKAIELELRKAVVAEHFEELTEGVNRCDIAGDSVLVATLPYNYSLDIDEIETGLKLVPKTKRDKLIIYKPSMSIKVYRTLSKKALTDFTAQCVTVKPGTPTLKIEAPAT